MVSVKPTGRFWWLDTDGFIGNDAALAKIPPAYTDPLAEVKDAYLKLLGGCINSIYVRGTVPRGMAVGDISDLDGFAFLHEGSTEPDPIWSHDTTKRLLTRYPFITGVGFECLARDALDVGFRFFELGLLMDFR